MAIDLERISDTLAGADTVRTVGRLRSVTGLAIEADIPGVRLGELCEVERRGGGEPLLAEVVGFRDHVATLLPYGVAEGLGPDDPVHPADRRLEVAVGDALLGRVLDGLGRPIDGGEALEGPRCEVMGPAPAPLSRPPIARRLSLGLRALDGLVTLGEGQRMGLFAGSGVGKSTLLGQIARGADADVFVVCLVGERGREVRDFLDEALGEEGRKRGVVVCATSDSPPLVRMKCPYVATSIAEGFRDQGKRVLLLMDSVTRFARAARDVGLAAGEAPARRGFPPSVLSALPGLVERTGTAERGSITAVYTVLVEGDDHDDPIADELRGLLDGHITLSRALAARGHHPAIDVPRSLSRVMPRLVEPAHLQAAAAVRAHVAIHEDKRDLVALGAYTRGGDPRLDAALDRIAAIEAFLQQARDERVAFEDVVAGLERLV
ncbi:MAG: FliI/YscN family ATPase [Myxococcales bacterium]|nr:FliI/YscN family ATPase [Myxococcales bacterium]